jgi:hypothetical protein
MVSVTHAAQCPLPFDKLRRALLRPTQADRQTLIANFRIVLHHKQANTDIAFSVRGASFLKYCRGGNILRLTFFYPNKRSLSPQNYLQELAMTFRINHMNTMNRLIIMWGASILIAASLFTGVALGEENQFPNKYSMEIDPAAKQHLGEQAFNEVMMFFHAAEKAIETKDMKGLMALYSDNYRDGDHDKKSAEQTWQRIFATFDTLSMLHKMKLEKMSADRNMVVLRCSGLLAGVPVHSKVPITIDNWSNQDHILVKEAGKWKLIGTYGLERKRLWFDKPMHPFF